MVNQAVLQLQRSPPLSVTLGTPVVTAAPHFRAESQTALRLQQAAPPAKRCLLAQGVAYALCIKVNNEGFYMSISQNPHRKIIIFLIIFVVLALPFVYYFVWRPSDSDYRAATSELQNMVTARSTVTAITGDIHHSVDINDTTVTNLEKAATKYDTNLVSLSKSAVASRDFTTKTVYDQQSGNLTGYGKAANSLAGSLKKYRSILKTCSDLVKDIGGYATTAEFDTAAKDCNASVDNAKTADYTPFNDQFLTNYASLSSDFLKAYRQLVAANTVSAQNTAIDGVVAVKQKIAKLGESKLDLAPASDPSEAFQKLLTTVNTQKAAFLR
jgi:preprotein translocase subunit YajC